MQQPCPHCGYSSDRPARFCRQCGADLFVEDEASSAETQDDSSRQESEASDRDPSTSKYESNSGLDDRTPQAARFYRPPAIPSYVGLTQKKSNAGVWILVALVGFMLVGGSVVTWMVDEFRDQTSYNSTQNEVASELESQMKNKIQVMVRDAQQQERTAKERAARAGDTPYKRIDSSERSNDFPTALEKYKYPNAQVEQITSVVDNDFVRMTTDDNFDYVSDFYKKIIGEPVTEHKEAKRGKAIFQVPGPPQVVIVVGPHNNDPDKTQIQILSSSIPHS